MAEIVIRVKLEPTIDQAGQEIQRKLTNALDAGTKATKDQEAAAVKLAQAQARLATASGNLGGAQTTLSNALANTTKQTLTTINAQTQLVQIQNRAVRSTRELGDSLSNLGGRLTLGVSAPLAALGIAAVKTATDFDSLKRGLIAVSGSSDAAEQQLTRLKEVAKLPGLGFKEAIQGSINLQAAGFSANRAEKALSAFGNALATVGKGKNELDGVILALTQIQSKGKVSAEEINQLAERVPQIRQIMLKAFGTADTEVIQRAKITSQKFTDAIVKELEKLPRVTGGAQNTFENLADSIQQSLLPLGNKLLETILPAIDKLSPKILGLLEGFQNLSSGTQQLVIGFGAAAIAAGPLIGALGNILKLLTSIRAIGTVGSVLGASGASLARFAATPLGAGLGVAGLAGIGVGLSVTLSEEELKRRGAAFEELAQRQISGNRPFINDAVAKEASRISGVPGALDFVQPAADSPIIDAVALAAQNAKRRQQKTELQKAQTEVGQLTQQVAALRTNEGKLFDEEFLLLQLRAERDERLKKLKNQAFDAFLISQGRSLPPNLPVAGITDAQRRAISVQALGSPQNISGFPSITTQQDIDAQIVDVNRARGDLANQRLRIQEVQIENQVTQGLLSQADAQKQLNAVRAASRDEIIKTLEEQRKAVGIDSLEGLRITEEIEKTRLLGVELSNAQRFMRGFGSATETVGDAFERLGQNVSRALTNTKNLLDNLKQAVIQFFNDLLGQSLQNLVRQTLLPIAGLFPGAAQQGALGGLFRTPSTFPAGGGANAFQSIANAVSGGGGGGGGGGGLAAPPSVSATGIFANGQFAAGLAGNAGNPFAPRQGATGIFANGQFAAGLAGKGGFFSSLFSNLAASAPLIGLGIGSSFGGQSPVGQVLGAAGAGAVGLGVSFGASIFGAGGGLASAALAALGPAALIGAPLIVGAILLGKAKQRKADEEASGQFLTQALTAIDQLAASVGSGQIDGSQARTIFDTQILATFKAQINTLKTASVRESRLTNQVRDLENVYQARIPPLLADVQRRQADAARFASIDSRLLPQFATGGIVRGIDQGFDSVRALLRPGEMVLNLAQQANIRAMAGSGIFDHAGVPGVNQSGRFAAGGIASPASSTIVINLDAVVDSEGIFIKGGSGRNAERLVVNHIENARTRGRRV
jgi:tape measure domain-containing protein